MATTDRDSSASDTLLSQLSAALAATRNGAPTKPVSVTLPAPLAEALRLLVDADRIESVSTVAAHALEEVLQAHVVALRLEEIYRDNPGAKPDKADIDSLAARADLNNDLPDTPTKK